MWNRFRPTLSSFRAQFVGASLTLGCAALLATSCSSTDPSTPGGTGGSGNAPGAGGSLGTAGGPPQCATKCNNVCTDLTANATNCGACGNVCPATAPFCSASVCAASCPAGTTTCTGACVNTATSATNCGACGTVCAANQACQNSVCVTTGGGTAGAGGMGGGVGGTGSGGTSAGGSGGTPAGGSSSAGEAGEAAEGGAAGSGDGVDPEIVAAQARAVVLIEGLESVRRCTTCHDVNYQGKGFYPNITPDVETGIGSWDAEDIKTAIHDGKDKDGETLCMTMERYDFTEAQLSDIAIYLQHLPAVSKKITVKCPQ